MNLQVIPITIEEANEFIRRFHRHHKPPQGYKFAIGVANGELVGVAIIGRPIARHNDDGWTLEVTRTCTDGTKNANSMLYGAAWRAARALGYRRMITYTLPEESGVSLRGAGFRLIGKTKDHENWSRKGRPRIDLHPEVKNRWELEMPQNKEKVTDDQFCR
jgi:hypothetical protein